MHDNERFVAVSTVRRTGSRIRECFSKPTGDFSATREWQQTMNAIRRIKQFAGKKNRGKVCRACLKETGAQHTASPLSSL